MLDVRMDAAIANEADQMKLPVAAALHRFEKQRLAKKLAARDERVDSRDVHMNDAARSHIQMAHFAIAHLPFGQSHKWPGSVDQCVWKIRHKAIIIWLARQRDGVSFRFGAKAPSVENSEHDWFWSFSHVGDRRLAREELNARGWRTNQIFLFAYVE